MGEGAEMALEQAMRDWENPIRIPWSFPVRYFSHLADPPIWIGEKKRYSVTEMHTPHIWHCINMLQTRCMKSLDRTAWIEIFNTELEHRLSKPFKLPKQTLKLRIKFRARRWLCNYKKSRLTKTS
jgi:hypothetical protein